MKKRYINPQTWCLQIKVVSHLLSDSISQSEERRTEEVLSRHTFQWDDDEEDE